MSPNTVRSESPAPRDWWWLFDPRLSLRAAAALLAGGGTALVLLLLTWSVALLLRRQIEAQLGGTFETLAAQLTDKIDRTIYERYRTLQLAANLTALRAPDVAPAERRRALEAVLAATPDFAWLGLADPTGRIIAATRGQSEGAAMGERSWFMLGRERPFAGNLREVTGAAREAASGDDSEPARIFELAVPVVGTSGELAGVIGAQVRWSWTRDVHLSVVSESWRRELIGATLYGPDHEVLLDSGASGWTQPPDAPAGVDPRRPRGTLVEETAGGTRYVTGFARSRGYREYRGLGWIAAVRQPIARAFAPVEALTRSILRWGALLVAAVVVASWVIAGRLARRFRAIGASADRIRGGDILSVLPRPKGDGELARMCAALDAMVEDFRARQDQLAAENARLAAKPREGEATKR